MTRTEQVVILEQRLVRQIARTSIEHGVLAPDDRVLVAVSGGKDSYSLLHLLLLLRPRLPFALDLVAVHIDQGQPGHQPAPLRDWLEQRGVPFEIVREETYQTVLKHAVDGTTPCAICARMRRGVLYTQAERLGCNKVALGHHRDDGLATLLLNLFYAGTLQAMPARYTTDDGRFEVIRPLIEVAERDLVRLRDLMAFPIIPCAVCGAQPDLKRAWVNQLLDQLEQDHPQLRAVMLGAIKNVRPSHLLDVELLKVVRGQSEENPGGRRS